MLPLKVVEFIDEKGASPFGSWFNDLDAGAAARITIALTRIESGNLSSAKGVGGGLLEYRIDSGPGYRIYFGRDGDTLIILLGGGTKRRQNKDIRQAKDHWADYKRRKKK